MEMLISLLIISVISLLVLPNIQRIQEKVSKDGDEAFIQMIETQIQLYKLDGKPISSDPLNDLKGKNYITDKQYKKASEMEHEW